MSRGPLPKSKSHRSGEAEKKAIAGRKGPIPPMPRRKGGWSQASKTWWKTVWESPMASEWLDVDRFALARIASLREQVEGGDDRATLLAEISKLEASFGLTPASRERLRWV